MRFLGVVAYLIAAALPVGLAALILLWISRGRVPSLAMKLLLALAFMVGPAYALWRIEWFDIWRHGTPPLAFIVRAYGPYLAFFAAAGWLTGGRLSAPPR